MSKIKVSVIGAGHAGRDFHLPGLSVFPDVDLSLCDINAARLNAAGSEFNIPPDRLYADYHKMLKKEDPEAVLVLMPQYPVGNFKPEIYFQIVRTVMDQRRAVLVEKPLALTPAAAKPLVDQAGKLGLITMVSVNRRFNPLVTFCKQAVEQHGPVLNVFCGYYKAYAPSPAGAPDWLTSDMLHALDLMRFLAGGATVDCQAAVTRTESDQAPTAFHALATFASGATGIFSSNVRAGERLLLCQIHGVNVSAVIQSEPAYPMASTSLSAVIYRPQERPAKYLDLEMPTGRPYLHGRDFHVWNGFAYADRYFINCVRSRQQPHCNFADAYQTLVLCQKILRSTVRTVSK